MIFRNPQLLFLLLLLPVFLLLWRWRGRRISATALVLRLLTVSLLVLVLADPILGREPPPPGPLVILADQSDSLTEQGQATLRAEAERLAQAAGERATILWFGANVVGNDWRLEAGASVQPDPQSPVVNLDPSATDLAGALRTARELLTPTGGRIILLSDGVQTSGDALEEARRAADAKITVDTMPVDLVQAPEIAITTMSVPRTLRVGEEYPVELVVTRRSQAQGGAVQATLRLWEGERMLAEQEVSLTPGDNDFTFRNRAEAPGIARLRAEIVGTTDTFARNNNAAATALVAPPPRVLLVEGRAGSSRDLSAALQRAGVESQTLAANRLPARLSELDAFDGVVLVDVPAGALSLEQMASVREFVRSEGRGLVAIGGRNSYGLGAYKDTPIEQALPVLMDPPPRPERPDIAMLLIVDRSASMTAASGVSKFDMAKEAAILATEALRSEDSVGILAFDTGQRWAVPFQRVGDGQNLQQIQDAIARLPSGGGTDIYGALAVGLPEIARQTATVRHVVLLTDGRSFTNDMPAYQQLLEAARAQRITLSTIAIGDDADTDLLDLLAQRGGGRYYFAAVPEDIPRLTMLESEIARTDPSVEGSFRAVLAESHPLMRDFAPSELPQLDGYVATTAKETADVVLRSPSDDPVLATWQYGLGRAVAWTPSANAPWANAWPGWPSYDRFWAQLVRYTLPEPDSGPLQVRLDPRPGGVRLTVDALQAGGQPLDLATVNARVTLPDGSQRDFGVRQIAPGRYTQDLLLPTDGPYAVTVGLARDSERQQVDVGYVQVAPAEYRISAGDDAAVRDAATALLTQIAQITGGNMLTQVGPGFGSGPGAAASGDLVQLWPWLLGLALLLWVLEIAVRRGVFVRS